MDDDAVATATERWVEAGILDEETAAAIRRFETDRDEEGFVQRRLARIVGLMGAVLVGAGILASLAANWESLSEAVRTGVLVAAPILSASAGVLLDRRGLPLGGRALWVLGAFLVGPSTGLLAEMHAPQMELFGLLLVWGLVALPMGHAFESRLATGLGIATLLLAAVDAAPSETGAFVAAALGAVVIAAVIPLRSRTPRLITTYQVVGFAPVIVTLLWLNTMDGRLELDIEWGASLFVAIALAIAAVGLGVVRWQNTRLESGHGLAISIPLLGTILALLVIGIEHVLPDLVAYLAVQTILLGVLLGIVLVGVWLGSRVLINLVALGFLLQVGTLLLTVADHLSGALALIVAGLVLLVVAIGLERGRRRLFRRLGRRE